MRQFTCALALTLLAGCAAQPSTPAPAPAPAPVAAAAPAAAPVAAGATTAKATYPGYKQKTFNGETVYCKKVAKIGSRFEEETCMTGPEMEKMMQQAEADKDQFRRNQTLCGTGGCGGS